MASSNDMAQINLGEILHFEEDYPEEDDYDYPEEEEDYPEIEEYLERDEDALEEEDYPERELVSLCWELSQD